MHRVKVQSWLNGELTSFEELANDFMEGVEKANGHDAHHKLHSQGHTIKVYNDNGEVVHSIDGTPSDTYA
jgi:hypothetical protein